MDWCSYFRLRDGGSFQALVTKTASEAKGYVKHPLQTITLSSGDVLVSQVFHKVGRPDEPAYLSLASRLAGTGLGTGQKGISHSIICLVEFAGHLYILTFGGGHSVANRMAIERRFGKIVVSNGKVQDEVRSLTAKIHGSRSKTRIERRGKGGPTRELEVPRNAHMASGVAAKFLLGQEHIASGDRAVRTIAATDADELARFLTTLEGLWNGGQEVDPVLAGYDRVVDVHDPLLIAQLDDDRRTAIRQNQMSQFSLCLEDEDLWQATGLDYFVNRKRLPIQVFDIPYIFGALHSAAVQPPGTDPLEVRYEAQVPGRKGAKDGFLADLLGYECRLPGHAEPFFFECGGWYQARAGWRVQVQGDVAKLELQSRQLLSGHGLPTYIAKETEDAFITRALACPWPQPCEKFHLLFGSAQPNLEACDIMHDGKHLFFVKRGSGRDACGDVAQQAADAANALVGDSAFLSWVNQVIQPKGWMLDMDLRKDLVFVVVLLIGNPNKPMTSLTIRAQDALSDHLREIERFGFRAAAVIC